MIIVKAMEGKSKIERRKTVPEATLIAALEAKRTGIDHGLYDVNNKNPFATVSPLYWDIYYGGEPK